MMKKIYTLLIALLIVGGIMGQGCLPDGITFETQAQIDSFQINYPGCTEIEGNVTISGENITNLSELNVLVYVAGDFIIDDNDSLANLNGLDNISSIGGNLKIGDLDEFELVSNPLLKHLSGLEGLLTINGSLTIMGNPSLHNLTGLNNLISISGGLSIHINDSLSTLSGLEGIAFIWGDLNIGSFSIQSSSGNSMLIDIYALENADIMGDLRIEANDLLSDCAIESICEYLENPNGEIYIQKNADGCDSPAEIQDSCVANAVSIGEIEFQEQITIYPNPSNSTLTIELPSQPSPNTFLTISNTNSQQLITQPITEPKTEIDISHLPNGIYIVKVWNDKEVMVEKVIKE